MATGSKDNTRLAIKWQLIILATQTWIFASLPSLLLYLFENSHIIKVKKIINVTHIYMKTMLLFWSFWFLIIRGSLPALTFSLWVPYRHLLNPQKKQRCSRKWFKDSLDFVTLFASWICFEKKYTQLMFEYNFIMIIENALVVVEMTSSQQGRGEESSLERLKGEI